MGFTGGIILLAIALAMIFFGKARKGEAMQQRSVAPGRAL
jgi:small neutral amino acid transporter SnatA (MarC family)